MGLQDLREKLIKNSKNLTQNRKSGDGGGVRLAVTTG